MKSPKLRLALAVALVVATNLSANPNPDSDDKIQAQVDRLISVKAVYDPSGLLACKSAGMVALLDRLFPETVARPKTMPLDVAKKLIAELGDERFAVRENASEKLRRDGRSHIAFVEQAALSEDPEVAKRARKLLDDWKGTASDPMRNPYFPRAFQKYLLDVTDTASQRAMAKRIVVALEARLDKTPKAELLKLCFIGINRWRTDEVHNELLPLLKLESPEPAIFAMRQISGRTGNGFVGRLQMGALKTDRRELIKVALNCKPSPVWDKKSIPAIIEAYRKIFEAKDPTWNFDDDPEFVGLMAWAAIRNHRLDEARLYLLDRTSSKNPKLALIAITRLGNQECFQNARAYPELLDKLRPHLKSNDPSFRAAAYRTLGVYKGDAVPPLLVAGLADADVNVLRWVGHGIASRHVLYPKGKSPIPQLLRAALDKSEDKAHRLRIGTMLEHVEKRPGDPFRWPTPSR